MSSLQKPGIIGLIFFGFRMKGAINDFFAVQAPERTAVIAEFIGQPFHVFPVLVHRIHIEIAVAEAGENDGSVAADGRLGVITGSGRQRLWV